MKYLVFCPCSHSLEAHAPEGCEGERGISCPCRHDQIGALNAAIDRARVDAVAVWHKPEEYQESEIA
jgi:hypothetical protein